MNKHLQHLATKRILYGADYNPDQWLDTPSVLEEDIEWMRQLKMTSASVGIFAWTAIEPADGVHTFGWLDALMDRFEKNDLSVFLATPSGSKPMWLSEAFPEVRRVSKNGQREPSGGRHNHCPTSPVYREHVRRINRELALRYGRHPALVLWHIGNELNGECHCDLCKQAFQEWLEQRYGDLDTLNRAWWTAFWNHTFTAWTQIPTQDPSIDGLALDWRRFVNDQHVSFLKNEMAPLRELTPAIPCTTNFMGTHGSTNYWQWSKHLDLISNDLYPLHSDREDSWHQSLHSDFIHSLMRGMAGGRPWMLMESAPSSVNWGSVNKLKRPAVLLQESLQAVANGADAIHYFQFRKGLGGFEKYHGAVVDHEGSANSRVFKECETVGAQLESLSELVGRTTEKAPVAMIYDWESRWALEASAGPKASASGDRHTEACLDHFKALRLAGLDVDLIPCDGDFSQYPVLVTPSLYLMSETTARRLTAFAEAGGTWIATYLTAYVDSTNCCWRGGFPGAGLREVFGLWNEETDNLYDDEKVMVDATFSAHGFATEAIDIVERLHSEGATVGARTDSEFYKGSPVILENKCGDGRVVYVGARLLEEGYVAFYSKLAEELALPSVSLPKGVVQKQRMGSCGPIEFLFNYTGQEIPFNLGIKCYRSTGDDQARTGETILLPYETLIAMPHGHAEPTLTINTQPHSNHENMQTI